MSEETTTAVKLDRRMFVTGQIEVVTGLHIGGLNEGLDIGGVDNPVIRNPLDNRPMIPGSSLKGKMRCALERLEGRDHSQPTGKPEHAACRCGQCDICRLFGVPAEVDLPEGEIGLTRLKARDCQLTSESAELLEGATQLPYTEAKMEVAIDRVNAKANPRELERVPRGAVFEMELVVDIYQGDQQEDLLSLLFAGLCLIEDDYLGGQGSRGSGQVSIAISGVTQKDHDTYRLGGSAEPIQVDIPEQLQNLPELAKEI
jgi:CRISPR-associated protein Csm3